MTVYPTGNKTRPITSGPYGWRIHPITGVRTFHYGWDNYGYTYNCAPEAGVVIFAQYNGTAGNHVQIRTPAGVIHGTMHNASFLVSVGQQVAEGQPLGVQGTTGGSTGIHNHTEVLVNSQYTDPEPFLDARVAGTAGGGTPFEEDEMQLTRIIHDSGSNSAPGFGQTGIITPVTGFVKTSTGLGSRAELEAWTAIANALGYTVTEKHVDEAGFTLSQRFAVPLGKATVDQEAIAKAVAAAIKGDLTVISNTLATLTDDEAKILAAIRAIPGGGGTDLTAVLAAISKIPTAEQNGAASRAAIVK